MIHRIYTSMSAKIKYFNYVLKPNTWIALVFPVGMSDGVYTIYPSGVDGEEVTVYCQFDAEGNWTVRTDVILETDRSYSCL